MKPVWRLQIRTLLWLLTAFADLIVSMYPKCERNQFESDESEKIGSTQDVFLQRRYKKEGSNKLSEFSDWMCAIQDSNAEAFYKVENKF